MYLECDGFNVIYGKDISKVNKAYHANACNSYIICEIPFDDTNKIITLIQQGFEFLDRELVYDIELMHAKVLGNNQVFDMLSQLNFSIERSISSEMLLFAYDAFDRDRRFHLERSFDSSISHRVLNSYAAYLNKRPITVAVVKYKNEIVGFTAFEEMDHFFAENLLGAVKKGIAGKFAAFPLYKFTLSQMMERSVKHYIGKVSSTNAASINLHNELGGRVINVVDKYIMRRRL